MKYIIAGIFLFVLLAGCTSSEGDLLLIDQSGGGGGAGKIYTGLSPVSVDNDANTIRLNVQPSSDWNGLFDGQEGSYYLDRANHTGTQTASTISDFNNNVEAQIEQADHNVLSEWNFNEQLLIAGGFAAGGASIIGGTGFFQNMIIAEDLNVVNVNDFNALGDIIPFVDDAYLLGTSAKRWAEIWGTDINATNIGATNAYLTTAQISGQVNIRDTADPTINAIDTDAGAGSQISTWKYDADTNSWQLQNRNDAGGFIDNAFTFNKVSQTLSTGTRRINLDGNLYIDHGASSRTSVYVEGNETLRVDGSGDVYYGDIGGSGRNAVIRANGANKLSAGNVDLNITDTFRLIDNPASMFLRDTGGGTGLKQWLIRSDDGGLLFAPQNDDGVGTGYWLQLTRDGTNTNRIGSLLVGNFADPLLDVNVTEDRVYVFGDFNVAGKSAIVTTGTVSPSLYIKAQTSSNTNPLLVQATGDISEGFPALVGSEAAIFQRNRTSAYGAAIALLGGSKGNSQIYFGDRDNIQAGIIRYEHRTNSFDFYTNTTKRASITPDYNFLIFSPDGNYGRLHTGMGLYQRKFLNNTANCSDTGSGQVCHSYTFRASQVLNSFRIDYQYRLTEDISPDPSLTVCFSTSSSSCTGVSGNLSDGSCSHIGDSRITRNATCYLHGVGALTENGTYYINIYIDGDGTSEAELFDSNIFIN